MKVEFTFVEMGYERFTVDLKNLDEQRLIEMLERNDGKYITYRNENDEFHYINLNYILSFRVIKDDD